MENPAPAVFLYGAPEDYANYRAALTSAGLRPCGEPQPRGCPGL